MLWLKSLLKITTPSQNDHGKTGGRSRNVHKSYKEGSISVDNRLSTRLDLLLHYENVSVSKIGDPI